jgi:hypothetical protein
MRDSVGAKVADVEARRATAGGSGRRPGRGGRLPRPKRG